MLKKKISSKFTSRLRWLIVITGLLVFTTILGLEILEEFYDCSSEPVCVPVSICDANQFPPDLYRIALIGELKKQYSRNGDLSEAEYKIALEQVIIEYDPKYGNPYGIVCNDMLFVRQDMPLLAKQYVKQHELLHALAPEIYDTEAKVNWAASKKHPLGLISTILFALQDGRKYFSSPQCYLVVGWKTFKLYFLM